MRFYRLVRDWVDRLMRGPGMQFKAAMLPAFVPAILAGFADASRLFVALCIAWAVFWVCFVFWRFWLHLREISVAGDEQYDRKDKFRLSREYHDSESATSAARRRRGRKRD